jgi:hypothetical protein
VRAGAPRRPLVLDKLQHAQDGRGECLAGQAPALHAHFTPTSASWLNLVERFFAAITTKRIRRATFASGPELEAVIDDYLLRHNADPKPFAWTKRATTIIEKERRALEALEAVENGNQALESEH